MKTVVCVFILTFLTGLTFPEIVDGIRLKVLAGNGTEILNVPENSNTDLLKSLTLSEDQFPCVFLCTSRTAPTAWRLGQYQWGHIMKKGKVERIMEITDEEITYTSKLTLADSSTDFAGSITCAGLDSPNPSITTNIFIDLATDKLSRFLNPGSTHIVRPNVGDKQIILPCHVSSISSDVYVEKLKTFSTSRIDLAFDNQENGFIIQTKGTHTDLNKYIGSYRCSQLGYDTSVSVNVEIQAPVDYYARPEGVEIITEGGRPLTLSCGSHVPMKFIVGAKDVSYNVTYFYNPSEKFKFSGKINYIPGMGEGGHITCSTEKDEQLQQWQLAATDYQVELSITGDRKEIQCSSSNGKASRLTLKYCQRHDECFLNPTDSLDNVLHTPCDGCVSAKPLKTGGFWANCTVEKVSKVELFYADIEQRLYTVNEVVPSSSTAKLSSDVHGSIVARWSSFYLSDNGGWVVPTDDFLLQEPTEEADGSYSSRITINNIDHPVSVIWSISIWNRKNVAELSEKICLSYEVYPHQKYSPDSLEEKGPQLGNFPVELVLLNVLSCLTGVIIMYFLGPHIYARQGDEGDETEEAENPASAVGCQHHNTNIRSQGSPAKIFVRNDTPMLTAEYTQPVTFQANSNPSATYRYSKQITSSQQQFQTSSSSCPTPLAPLQEVESSPQKSAEFEPKHSDSSKKKTKGAKKKKRRGLDNNKNTPPPVPMKKRRWTEKV